MNISLLVLRCKDIEISKSFYEHLGFAFIKEKHDGGPEHYASENGEFVLELYPNKGEAPNDNNRFGFNVSDIHGVISKIGFADEYEFDGKITYIIEDPDGRKVEIS